MSNSTTTDLLPEKSRERRWLRVAWTVFFGVLTVALCVLWVRSWYGGEYVYWNIFKHRSVIVGSRSGGMVAYTDHFTIGLKPYRFRVIDAGDFYLLTRWGPVEPLMSTTRRIPIRAVGLKAFFSPHWFLVLSTATLTAACGIRRPHRIHFSLRTMLIATTLIAAVLGILMWSLNQ